MSGYSAMNHFSWHNSLYPTEFICTWQSYDSACLYSTSFCFIIKGCFAVFLYCSIQGYDAMKSGRWALRFWKNIVQNPGSLGFWTLSIIFFSKENGVLETGTVSDEGVENRLFCPLERADLRDWITTMLPCVIGCPAIDVSSY
jgi:hypothetical protein